jgi:hypothetical protein
MEIMTQQNSRLATFSAFLGGCLWMIIAMFTFIVSKENVKAIFTDFSLYKTTSGEVVSSTVVYKSGLGGSWHFEIAYRYTVLGREFSSNKVHYLNTGESLSDDYARSYVKKYPVGKVVTVFYNPDQPQQAVLEPDKRSNSSLWLIVCMAGMSIIFFTISLQLFLRKDSKSH